MTIFFSKQFTFSTCEVSTHQPSITTGNRPKQQSIGIKFNSIINSNQGIQSLQNSLLEY